jgi:hypothetical protein
MTVHREFGRSICRVQQARANLHLRMKMQVR